MKKLFVLITLLSIVTTAKGDVLCKKEGRYWYPQNEKAKKIATMLGVKTCNGKRFKKVVAQLGERTNVKAGKKSMSIEDVVKAVK